MAVFVTFLFAAPLHTFGTASVSTLASANISADLAGSTYLTLTGPVLDEGNNQDVGTGTIVLRAPAGFAFDPNATVTATVSRLKGSGALLALASGTATVTANTITITVTAMDEKGSATRSRIAWAGIRVQALAGTPLAQGNLVDTGSAGISGISSSTSFGTLTEVAGAVTQLAFTTQPGNVIAGAPFGTPPVVKTQDQFGNNATSGLTANNFVTISLSSGAGPLQGTTTLNIGLNSGRGTAAYSTLRLDVAGPNRQLTVTSTNGWPDATSAAFAVAPGAASKLVLANQPSPTAVAGVPFDQQPSVLIEDAYNNIRSNDTLVVTAIRQAGEGNLAGTTNMAASGGLAVFTNLAALVANSITVAFTSGSLAPAVSDAIVVSPAAFSRLQLLVPGEFALPGTPSGKTGAPSAERVGAGFTVTINGVDAYWNVVATNDFIHLTSSDTNALLPGDAPLVNGTLAQTLTNQNSGTQTLSVTDLTQLEILGVTSSAYTVAPPGPVLPVQPDRSLNEMTTLVVTNTADYVPYVTNPPVITVTTNTYLFNYSGRNALLADGWSFIATLPGGIPRNTEITNPALGAVVSYDQIAHPGTLRIPCDLGDEWTTANNSRNSLFRALPADWTSMRLAIAFNPTIDVQQAHLMCYQDDDNFIQAGVAHNSSLGGEVTTLVWEENASPSHFVTVVTNLTNLYFRLDRNQATGLISGFYSLNGTTWISLGSASPTLVNPRLGIWVGGSPVGWTNGLAQCDLKRVDVISSNVPAPPLSYQLVAPSPSGAAIDADGIITWTPSEAQGPGTNVITTLVTDNGTPPASATNSFTAVVSEVNSPPVLPPQADSWLGFGALLTVDNAAADADLPPNLLTYQLLTPPSPGSATIDTNGLIRWTAGLTPSTNTFVTVVTDSNPWAINAQHLSATNSFNVYVGDFALQRPQLPVQSDRVVNELALLQVTNTAAAAPLAGQVITNTIQFGYTNRTALLADGWSFMATLPGGTPRNTEITNAVDGPLADYNQAVHPGALRIACDLGDLWASANNTRNSLFRALPASWLSARLTLVFAPTLAAQQAHLVIYQDDDNYFQAGLAYSGGEKTAADLETNGTPTTLVTAPVAVNAVQLRLDRDLATGNLTALYSADGSSWSTLAQVSQAFVNPRLGIWVGGSPIAWTNGLAQCDLQRLDIVTTNYVPTVLAYQLANAPAGAAIDGAGVITWTPDEAQGPGTNQIVTIVTDNSMPPLTDTNSFTVIVNEVNTAPVLPALPNLTIVGQAPLTVTNTATDSDIPANPLSYQLLSPAGAVVDSNGIISWTPTPDQVPSTQTFVTVVTDSNPWAANTQNLSATNSFTVVVTSSGGSTVTLTYQATANTIQLSLSGTPGATYQVLWAPDLTTPWTLLATVQADANGQVLYQGSAPASTAFFRVLGP